MSTHSDYYHTMDEQAYGLPPGTLSRDQRTTITNRQCCDRLNTYYHGICDMHHFSDNTNMSSANTSTSTCNTRTHIRRKYFPKFSEVVFWIALICSMQVSCKAAPTRKSTSPSRVHRSTAHMWMNPCEFSDPNGLNPEDGSVQAVSDHELLSQIALQAKTAFSAISRSKENYVKDTFGINYDEHHASWINSHYEWLPNENSLHKSLGESLSGEYLDSIKNDLEKTLIDTFENLQKFAVGLEEVIKDAQDSKYRDLFSNASFQLRALLCEIQVAIIEKGASTRTDVSSEIMSEELRSLTGSGRDIRDWIIYRDYMNMLEYTIEVFDFYKSNLA